MAIFKYTGNSLHTGLHGARGARGKPVAFRFHMKRGGKVEFRPKGGKPHFDKGDEFEVINTRVIRHLKVDPRFELVSE